MKLISDEYRKQLTELHSAKEDFGTTSTMYLPIISGVVRKYLCEDVIDYGCGKQALKPHFSSGYHGYDPAIPGYSDVPNPRDLVICTDVLEHIEPGREDAVIQDIARCARKVAFLAIHTGKALNVLPDGRNAHLIQQPARWWLPKLCKHFHIKAMEAGDNGFWVIAEALDGAK